MDDPCAQGVETLLAEDGDEGCVEERGIDKVADASNSEALSNDHSSTSEKVAKVDESESRKAHSFLKEESFADSLTPLSNPTSQPTDDSYGRLSTVGLTYNAEKCKGRGFKEEEPAAQDVTSPANSQPLFTNTSSGKLPKPELNNKANYPSDVSSMESNQSQTPQPLPLT